MKNRMPSLMKNKLYYKPMMTVGRAMKERMEKKEKKGGKTKKSNKKVLISIILNR